MNIYEATQEYGNKLVQGLREHPFVNYVEVRGGEVLRQHGDRMMYGALPAAEGIRQAALYQQGGEVATTDASLMAGIPLAVGIGGLVLTGLKKILDKANDDYSNDQAHLHHNRGIAELTDPKD